MLSKMMRASLNCHLPLKKKTVHKTTCKVIFLFHPHRRKCSFRLFTMLCWNQAKAQNRAKQESSVINCSLLALLKKIKGTKLQSSDRLLGQAVDGGRKEAEVFTESYSADSHILPSVSAGTLPLGSGLQTHKLLMLQRQQLQDSSCYCVHTCMCHYHFSLHTKSVCLTIQCIVCPVVHQSFYNGMALFSSYSCRINIHTVSQLAKQ